MSEKLRKKAIHFLDCRDYFEEEFAYRPPHAYDKEMLLDHFTDFAAECVKDALALADAADNYCDGCGDIVQVNAIERAIRAERERADRLHAKLVEIEQSYLAHGTECSSCYDLFTIAVLAQEGK